MTKETPIIYIVGPTASGKTGVAIELAKEIDGEIICADSRTIYQDMNIGTAKPDLVEQDGIKHWCLDLARPGDNFSVADWQVAAQTAVEDIKKRSKIPIVVGGSGLYINSLLYQYDFKRPMADTKLRSELEAKTVDQLITICKKHNYDYNSAQKNKRRLIRIIEAKGQKSSSNQKNNRDIVVGITTDKDELLNRVRTRIVQMLEQGLLAETQYLVEKYGLNNEAMTANIYSLAQDLIDQKITTDQFIELAWRKDKYLIKKQLTWFKRDQNIIWLSRDEVKNFIVQKIDNMIKCN